MTIEYVLLLIVVFGFGLKAFVSAPAEAFKNAGPRLAARVEQQLSTGDGFKANGSHLEWEEDK